MPHHPDCPARDAPPQSAAGTCPACGHRVRGRFVNANAPNDTRPAAVRPAGANETARAAAAHANRAARRNKLQKRRLRMPGRTFTVGPILIVGVGFVLVPLIFTLVDVTVSDRPTAREARGAVALASMAMTGVGMIVGDLLGLFDFE